MGKIEEAIKKINIDMQKEPDEENLEKIGEYVIDHIRTEEDAEAVLAEDKSLKKIYDEIRGEAYQKALKKYQKREVVLEKNCVGIACEGERTLERVMKYFGLSATNKAARTETAKPQTAAEVPTAPKKEKEVDLDFDSFFA